MASLLEVVVVVAMPVLFLMGLSLSTNNGGGVEATWCVTRSEASDQALQTALDYACGAGADCAPIQSSGLCYLPNTLQSHASYAFNSYYQRRGNAPGSCDFSGTATVAGTDPSYGSCVFPSSQSTAGGTGGTPTTNPSVIAPPPPATTVPLYGNGGLTPTNTNNSRASMEFSITTILISISCFLLLSFTYQQQLM
ncbi:PLASMODESMATA CALLOSE-BINDING PROTEIN 3 [Camellia lanceoleosa]|uniref:PLASMODESMATA CALLOSE-BINDING PROTEIN 3 n=1 Tax=Camellia lanceoleosa TaxID=1840588 RepID=A0ACC0GNL1_9ERIC|nr:PLASMODESMATA CALLOSE-BINDING PROTEIN 3 [Camellia lanceoleosa]